MRTMDKKRISFAFAIIIAVMLILACTLVCTTQMTALANSTSASTIDFGSDGITDHDHSTMTALTECPTDGELNGGEDGAAYYLNADIAGNLTVTGNVILCLNGRTITGDGNGSGVTGDENGSVITVSSGATFTLCDCNEDNEDQGCITGGTGTLFTGYYAGSIYCGGGVYVENGATFKMTGGTICHNKLRVNQGGGVYVDGGTFEMSGGTISDNTANNGDEFTLSEGGGVRVVNEGVFKMSQGNISGNYGVFGAGVNVADESTFEMTGGTINNNNSNLYEEELSKGGGVYTYWGDFTLSGGEISGNEACLGGGVYTCVKDFTMFGGEIRGNKANLGGGVYVDTGYFTMTGGTISENEVRNEYYGGGGVYLYDASFEMSGGEIRKNESNAHGGGVYVEDSTFVMTAGTISENNAHEYYGGGGVYVESSGEIELSGIPQIIGNTVGGLENETDNNLYLGFPSLRITVTGALEKDGEKAQIGVTLDDDDVVFTDGYGSNNTTLPSRYFIPDDKFAVVLENGEAKLSKAATVRLGSGSATTYDTIEDAFSGANALNTTSEEIAVITLLADVATSSSLTVESGKYITLDLNGKMLKFTGSSGSVISVEGNFTLDDSEKVKPEEERTPHKYKVSTDASTKGLWIFDEVNGAEILYGGVVTGGKGTFGGYYTSGGGVYVDDGEFIMESGSICGNTASSGGGVDIADRRTFIMESGRISGNTAVNSGGGVVVTGSSGEFTMNGGEISNNTVIGANAYGSGGVTAFGKFYISGNPKIFGNKIGSLTDGVDNNVLLNNNKKITVTDELTEGAIIGVTTMSKPPYVFTTGYTDSGNGSVDPYDYFIPDNKQYMTITDGGEAKIVPIVAIVTEGSNDPVNFHTVANAFAYANGLETDKNNFAEITLLTDVLTDNTLTVEAGKFITLDLNGKMLKYNGSSNNSVITVKGNFTLTDSENDLPEEQKTQHKYSVSTATSTKGLWIFDDSGTETLYGGVICGGKGNSSSYNDGGGVYIAADGVFVMDSGAICGNIANRGGGVDVYCSNDYKQYGTFEMTGGKICGNVATMASAGVHSAAAKTFKLHGTPVIKDNKKTDGVEQNVYISANITINGELEEGAQVGIYRDQMTTFAIGYNQSDAPSKYFFSDKAQYNCIYVSNINNGTVSIGTHSTSTAWSYDDNTHWHECGRCGEKLGEGEHSNTSLTCSVCGVSNNFEVSVSGSKTYYTTIAVAFDYANGQSEVTVKMYADANTSSNLTVDSGKYITLDLNGKMLKYTGERGSVITVYGNFTLIDSNATAEQKTTHNYYVSESSRNVGTWVFVDENFENAENYEIKTLSGGVITGGNNYYGSGVYVPNGGSFTMTGGTIAGNFAENNGGGVALGTNQNVDGGSFTMTGGAISGNYATQSGVGVFIGNAGEFVMENGEITFNVAAYGVGGVAVLGGDFTVKGTPIIIGNIYKAYNNMETDNVYLYSGKKITVGGELKEGAQIGVYNTGVVTTGYDTTYGAPYQYFISDKKITRRLWTRTVKSSSF